VWGEQPQGHWRWCVAQGRTHGETVWEDVGPIKGIEGMYTEEEIAFEY
jgi:hypothetical protein